MFQLTASRGGWLKEDEKWKNLKKFQLTASRGGWPAQHFDGAREFLFQLTASRGGWRPLFLSYGLITLFQLTASRGGWLIVQSEGLRADRFNSQPHEEADGNFEQKYLLRNCIFYNYCIYYFLYLSCIQLFMHFFSLNLPIFRCECPRESCVLSFRTYNIKVSVTSKPGLAPICSILFLYFSPK